MEQTFPDLLNIVVIVKTNITTQPRAQVVLFSSDLTLAHDKLIHYCRLRLQIEFNFRDAKQFWGLGDFMNVNQKPVRTAANFALSITNLAALLVRIQRSQLQSPAFSRTDLKVDSIGLTHSEAVEE